MKIYLVWGVTKNTDEGFFDLLGVYKSKERAEAMCNSEGTWRETVSDMEIEEKDLPESAKLLFLNLTKAKK